MRVHVACGYCCCGFNRCFSLDCFQILQLKLKCSDFVIMRLGLIGMAVAFMFLAFFQNIYLFFAACVTLGFGGLINPSANAIISTYVSDKDQGLAQGAFSSVSFLSAIVAQVIFEPLFILGITKYQNAGFPFYFAFAFCVIAVCCAVVFERIFFLESHDMSNPRYSSPRRAVVFCPLADVVHLSESLTAVDSKNRRAFNFRPSHTLELRQSLVAPVSAANGTQ